MFWKLPPRIKIYEALGAIADGRVEVMENTAKVYSSSKKKVYIVEFDPSNNAITANDNGSYYQGYLGYPAIAFLLVKQIISYNKTVLPWLRDIPWKDINTKFKNDFEKTEQYVRELVVGRKGDLKVLDEDIHDIETAIFELSLEKLPSNRKPPEGY